MMISFRQPILIAYWEANLCEPYTYAYVNGWIVLFSG